MKVKSLRHMVELLRDAQAKYTTLKFDDRASETIVFDHKDALAATEDVISDNGIRQRASDDLAAVWEAKSRTATKAPGDDKDRGKDKDKDKGGQ